MEFCSDIYSGMAFFGGYPREHEFHELLMNHVSTFVDLTTPFERTLLPFVYENRCPPWAQYINFPILDNKTPKNRTGFISLVRHLAELVRNKKKIYIHCKGGHGRSGILVSSLLSYLHNIPPDRAIQLCTFFHAKRPNLKTKWKHITCPQKLQQQQFVLEAFRPMRITETDQYKRLTDDPDAFFEMIGLRPIVSDKQMENPFIPDFVVYLREIWHKSKKNQVA